MIIAIVLLTVAFGIAISGLRTDSLWNDEAWSVWAVSAPTLGESLARIRADVHPPLYFLFLYGWIRVAGESAMAIRLLSTFFGLIGLAATYAVGARLVDRWTGLIAVAVLGASGFFIYYTREARMYTLLLALASLATWAYLWWRSKPTWRRALVYGLLMAAMLYTHYSGALVILTHGLHLLLTGGWRMIVSSGEPRATRTRSIGFGVVRFVAPYVIAFIAYLPWLPTFLNQMRANPNGPLAIPVPTDWGTVAGLVLILTAGVWILFVLPFILGTAIPRLREYWRGALLLVLWLLLTPILLLVLNAWFAPVYQVRYAIAMLPAGALLLAYGLRWMGIPFARAVQTWLGERLAGKRTQYIVSLLMVVFFLGWFAQSQWATYEGLWAHKHHWESTISSMVAARDPQSLTISDLAPYSPSAYYDRQLGIRQGESLDLSWRLHNADEVRQLMARLADTSSVWVALPINTAKTWQVVAALDVGRGVVYRDALVNMIFYQFEAGATGDLTFQFGDLLHVADAPGAGEQLTAAPGEPLCVDVALQTLMPLDGAHSAGLHLVDITGTQVIAQWDAGLDVHVADETINLSPCLDIPADAPVGGYHLELVIYEWATQKRSLLFEVSQEPPQWWGESLVLAAVSVGG